MIFLHRNAISSLYCADVPLSNYSLTDLSNEPDAITTGMIFISTISLFYLLNELHQYRCATYHKTQTHTWEE